MDAGVAHHFEVYDGAHGHTLSAPVTTSTPPSITSLRSATMLTAR